MWRRALSITVAAALLTWFAVTFRHGLGEEIGLVRPYALLLAALGALGLVAGACRPQLQGTVAGALRHLPLPLFLGGTMALAALLTLYCHRYAYGGYPHTPDDATYLFQARLLAAGHLTAPAPPHREFFQFRFCLQEHGRWFGIFPPGWPAVLALGVAFGQPWLVNPILALLLVPLTYVLGREIAPGQPLVARLAAVLAALSLARMVHSVTLLSHPLGAVCTAAALWAALRALRTGHAALLGVAGLLVGLQGATRLLNGFSLGLPVLGLGVAFAVRWRRTPRAVVAALSSLALGVALLVGLQLAYNRAVTGAALRFPQRAYFAATEPRPRCSDPGFGDDRVCLHEHPPPLTTSLPRTDFHPHHVVTLTRLRLDYYGREAAGGLLFMGFLVVGLAARTTRRAAARCALGYGALWVSYMSFYWHGITYTSRYFFEGSPCVWLGMALGMAAVLRLEGGRALRALRGAAAGVTLGLIAVLPTVRWAGFRQIWFPELPPYPQLERALAGLRSAIVLHANQWAPPTLNARPFDLASQAVIVARDHGPDAAQVLLEHYPGRRLYRWDVGREILEPIPATPGRLALKGDSFFPVDRLRQAYAAPIWVPGGSCLKLHGAAPGAQAEIRIHFPPGDYEVQPIFVTGRDAGVARLELDGRVIADGIDLLEDQPHTRAAPPRRVTLAGQQHLLRLSVVGKAPAASGYTACLDRVTLQLSR